LTAEIPSAGESAGQSLVVLAVDDDVLVQMNTVAMLEDLGHTVLEASNGAEALEVFRANPNIQLVITDQAMPHMTGKDLAIAIVKERPGVPIIIATGYAELPAGMAADAVRLPKPFDMDDLAQAIAKATKG
jgi:CheY-like chemotaxis protein